MLAHCFGGWSVHLCALVEGLEAWNVHTVEIHMQILKKKEHWSSSLSMKQAKYINRPRNDAREEKRKEKKKKKKVNLGHQSIRAWSPTALLTRPYNAWLRRSDGMRYVQCGMAPDEFQCVWVQFIWWNNVRWANLKLGWAHPAVEFFYI